MGKKILSLILIIIGVILIGVGSFLSYNNSDKENKKDEVKNKETFLKTEKEDILYEDELYKVTFNRFDYSSSKFLISFYIENKTDVEMDVETNDECINSIMSINLFEDELGKKETIEFTMFYEHSYLKTRNINSFEDIKEISFELSIWNNDYEDLERNINIKLYPHDDREYDYVNYQATNEDNVLLDTEDYTVINTGFELYDNRVIYMNLYAINRTDKDIAIQLKNSSLGDTTPINKQILPKKELIESLSWWENESTVESLKEITFNVCILDRKDYSEIYCTPEKIVVHPDFGE